MEDAYRYLWERLRIAVLQDSRGKDGVDVRFGPFTLAVGARQLRRDMQVVRLSPKAFDLLVFLAQRRPEAITKADIHERLWGETFVSDVNVAVLVAEIRAALGEDARHSRFIRTVHRFGYAFSGAATDVVEHTGGAHLAGITTYCLAWGAERALLHTGENVVGRDSSVDVCVAAAGVSRRHAIVVVTAGEVTLQDLGSKNGTYVDDVLVTSSILLTDGAHIRFGSASVCFRQLSDSTSTQTATHSGPRAHQ